MVRVSQKAAPRKSARPRRPFGEGLFPAVPTCPPVDRLADPETRRLRLARAIAAFRWTQHAVVLTPDEALAAVDALFASEIRVPKCEILEGGAR